MATKSNELLATVANLGSEPMNIRRYHMKGNESPYTLSMFQSRKTNSLVLALRENGTLARAPKPMPLCWEPVRCV